jgi:hypothetical protein
MKAQKTPRKTVGWSTLTPSLLMLPSETEMRFEASLVDSASRIAGFIGARFAPPLSPMDVFGLTVLTLRGELEPTFLSAASGVAVVEMLKRAECTAIALGLFALEPLAIRAGLVPQIALPTYRAVEYAHAKWWCWREDLGNVVGRCRARGLAPSGVPRDDLLVLGYRAILERPTLSGSALLGDIAAGKREAQGRKLTPDESSGLTLAADCRLAARGEDIPFEWVRFGTDGKWHISKRAVRDRMRSAAKAEREWDSRVEYFEQRPKMKRGRALDTPFHTDGASVSPDPAESCSTNEQRLQEIAMLRQLDQVVQRRLSRTTPSSANAAILRNFCELVGGEITQADIGRLGGWSKSTVADAWKREKQAVGRALCNPRKSA